MSIFALSTFFLLFHSSFHLIYHYPLSFLSAMVTHTSTHLPATFLRHIFLPQPFLFAILSSVFLSIPHMLSSYKTLCLTFTFFSYFYKFCHALLKRHSLLTGNLLKAGIGDPFNQLYCVMVMQTISRTLPMFLLYYH
jgi:hypothetical protein